MAVGMLPWLTSDTLISTVKLRISLPTFQSTFSDDDILTLANQELLISQVPDVLKYHSEYFVTRLTIPLIPNVVRYPVPERAIGSRIRDLSYQDTAFPVPNLFEMTAINPDDKTFFQQTSVNTNYVARYYIEGNEIVLTPTVNASPVGSLVFFYYIRPNQLVSTSRVGTIQSYGSLLTVFNSNINPGDTVTLQTQTYEPGQFAFSNEVLTQVLATFTAVSASPGPNEFLIDISNAATAENLANAISLNGIASSVSTGSSVTLSYSDFSLDVVSSNITGISINPNLLINLDQVPSNITVGSYVDFLQTKPGHRTYSISILIPPGGISGNTLLLNPSLLDSNMVVGDYVASEYECIIPQIPTDLHSGLVERVCARILSAQGDYQALQEAQSKIQQINSAEGTLLDNRTEGTGRKVTATHSLLRYGRRYFYRGG